MKNLMFLTFSGYLGKTFTNKIAAESLVQCVRQRGTNTDSIKPFQSFLNSNVTIFKKSSVDTSYKQGFNNYVKRFCSSFPKRTSLMDFEVAVSPNLFNILKIGFLRLFKIESIDGKFNVGEFINNSKTALEVVTRLLSESRFSELNDLLTKECKEEVQKNVCALSNSQKADLAVAFKDIYYAFPYDLEILTGADGSDKKFLQITMVYHICKNFDNAFITPSLDELSIYNCRFFKECAKEINNDWTINAINVFKMRDDPKFRRSVTVKF